jgi:hypothetical protein
MALPSLPCTMLLVDDSESAHPAGTAVCNLYSITTSQAAIRALFRVVNRSFGNLPPMPGVFPDYPAPVVRNAGDKREMVLMRWGAPAIHNGARDQHCDGVAEPACRLTSTSAAYTHNSSDSMSRSLCRSASSSSIRA